MKKKICCVLLGLLFYTDLFAQINVENNSQRTFVNPLSFIMPNDNSGYEDVLEYLSAKPGVEILLNNGRSIKFIYDGGVDWITGCEGNCYVTDICFYSDIDRVSFLRLHPTKDVPLMECAVHSVRYFTEHIGIKPVETYKSYKPKGAEYFIYRWDLKDYKIKVRIDDWSNGWNNQWFQIEVSK